MCARRRRERADSHRRVDGTFHRASGRPPNVRHSPTGLSRDARLPLRLRLVGSDEPAAGRPDRRRSHRAHPAGTVPHRSVDSSSVARSRSRARCSEPLPVDGRARPVCRATTTCGSRGRRSMLAHTSTARASRRRQPPCVRSRCKRSRTWREPSPSSPRSDEQWRVITKTSRRVAVCRSPSARQRHAR